MPNPELPFTDVETYAITLHEHMMAFARAGFTREEAVSLICAIFLIKRQ